MNPTIYDQVNEIYKAFISDFINDDNTRQKLNRLKNENGSFNNDFVLLLNEHNECLKKEFNSPSKSNFVTKIIRSIIAKYMHQIWNIPSLEYSAEDNKSYFWKKITDSDDFFLNHLEPFYAKLNSQKLNNDYNLRAILKSKDDSFTCFYRALVYIKKFLGIETDLEFSNKLHFDSERTLQRWKSNKTLPNNYIEIKSHIEKLFDEYSLDKDIKNDFRFILYLSLGKSRLSKLATKHKIIIPNFEISSKTNEYKNIINRINKYPTDTVNISRYKRISSLKEDSAAAESFRLLAMGNYIYYITRDFGEAKINFKLAFEIGRYILGNYSKTLILQLMHCARMTNDKETFSRVFNWYNIIGDNNFNSNKNSTDSKEKKWKELSLPNPIFFTINEHEGLKI